MIYIRFNSIDPGLVNVGFACGFLCIDASKREAEVLIERVSKVSLVHGKCDVNKWSNMIEEGIDKLFLNRLYNSDVQLRVFIIEHQYWKEKAPSMTKKLSLFETLICQAFASRGWSVVPLNSLSYKNKLGIASGKSHAANKKLALEYTKLLLGEGAFRRHVRGCDHIADAINQVSYWAQDYLLQNFPQMSFKINYRFF
jgi:Holliday junction resolvasome RuvABC endonuclease subunit